MPHMTTYGPQLDQKWTGSGAKMGRKWCPSFHLSVILSVCQSRSGLEVSVCPSVPNISLTTTLTNLMRGNYKRRALAPCDFLKCLLLFNGVNSEISLGLFAGEGIIHPYF